MHTINGHGQAIGDPQARAIARGMENRQLLQAEMNAAMERGDFYATTGVELETLAFSKRKLDITVKPQAGVNYTIQFWGAGKSSTSKESVGVLLKEGKGTSASYKLRKKNLYVRAKVISSKPKQNPFAEGDFETAWTQPVTFPRR